MSKIQKHYPCYRGEHYNDQGQWVPFIGDVNPYDRDGEVFVCDNCLEDGDPEAAKWVKALRGEIPTHHTLLPVEKFDYFQQEQQGHAGDEQ